VNPLPSQAGWQIVPLAMLLPPWSWAQNFAVAEAGILSPHHKTNTYFTGVLIKIEQFAGLCNWTLVPRNSSDSNRDNTKCYRTGAVAERPRFGPIDKCAERGIVRRDCRRVVHSGHMPAYKLMRQGALVQVFVDGRSSGKTLSANQRNELRDFLASVGLAQADIDFKVHELYLTNATSFTGS
jgi:hypothetical protein